MCCTWQCNEIDKSLSRVIIRGRNLFEELRYIKDAPCCRLCSFFDLIVTLFVNEPRNPFLFTVSVNMSLKMYSFYAKVKFLWELGAS